ncbi:MULTISPECIES: SDR family NAD(P)-dependent oxidoreductase [unclassified Nocardia]|uniref:SDR family NAD(P)-dependent oxidoreductase n=1 Tax=unclassified Nocardia TaxID=2637762 RepID=UPI001CE3EDF5|nr:MULTISPECIES: SDR family NAD(P)-dependent oxidoreductase [unclassified Nocardia]
MLEFRTSPNHRRVEPVESIAGLRILLTDACSGVGRATAALLASRGARLLLVGRRGDRLVPLSEELGRVGAQVHWCRCDIAALGDVDQLTDWVLREFGSVDVLINNAGRPLCRPVAQSVDRFRDYQRTMAAEYFGPLRLTLGLLPAMLAAGSGQVINVAPENTGATSNFAPYTSAQAAWTAFAECAAAELSPQGVQVTSVRYAGVSAAEEPDFGFDAETVARKVAAVIQVRQLRQETRMPPEAARLSRAFGL